MCMLNELAHQSSMQELDLLNPQLDPRITFARASTKTYFGADGLLHTAAADEWPLEYDPITLQPIGRSVWEQRTNLFTISGAWNALNNNDATSVLSQEMSDLPPVAGVTSVARVEKAVGRNGTWYHYSSATGANAVQPNVLNTRSFFFKPVLNCAKVQGATASLNKFQFSYDFATEAIAPGANAGAVTVQKLSGGWYRFSVTQKVADTDAAYTFVVVGVPAVAADPAVFLSTGYQTEAGAFPSPYIPTAGSQVTRVADVAYCAAADMGFNPTGSTLVVQKQYAANVLGFTYGRGNSQLLRLSTGSNGSTNFRNQIVLGANRVGGPTSPKYLNARFRDLDGTGYDVNVDLDALSSGPPLDDTSPVVAALSFKKGEFVALAARGVAKRVNDAAVPTFNFTDLNLSQAYDGTTFCGWIKSCRVYPSGVSKEELEALTA